MSVSTLRKVLLGEELANPLFRAPDHGPVPAQNDGPLEQGRVLQQDLHDGHWRQVVIGLQAKLFELCVLADQLRDRTVQDRNDSLQRRTVRTGSLLQILDGVELDAELLRDGNSVLRGGSVGVVVDRHVGHGASVEHEIRGVARASAPRDPRVSALCGSIRTPPTAPVRCQRDANEMPTRCQRDGQARCRRCEAWPPRQSRRSASGM